MPRILGDGGHTHKKMFNIISHRGKSQIKTTMSYQFTPTRMAIILQRQTTGRNVEKQEPSYTAGRNLRCLFIKSFLKCLT